MAPMRRAPATALQVVMSPVVLQLAGVGSVNNWVEEELGEALDLIAFLVLVLGASVQKSRTML